VGNPEITMHVPRKLKGVNRHLRRALVCSLVALSMQVSIMSICIADTSRCERIDAKSRVYSTLRLAVYDSLLSQISSQTKSRQPEFTVLTKEEVRHFALKALSRKSIEFAATDNYTWECGQGEKLEEMLSAYITYANDSIVGDAHLPWEVIIDTYLRNLFRESGAVVTTDPEIIKHLTGCRLLPGYKLIHLNENAISSHLSVEITARTRLKDWRVPNRTIKIRDIGDIPEGRFLDLFLEITLISITSQYQSTVVGGIIEPDRASSKNFSLSSVLYFVPWKYRFTDYGSLGAFARFEVVSLESSSDVFRRIVFGLRMESRSKKYEILQESIELGLAPRSVPGSFQETTIVGLGRLYFRLDLPIRLSDFASLALQVKSEWNFGSKFTLPVYELRVGVEFDPLRLLR